MLRQINDSSVQQVQAPLIINESPSASIAQSLLPTTTTASASTVEVIRSDPDWPLSTQWLFERAVSTPGFGAFRKRKGHILQNKQVVEAWQFAASFTDRYYKTVAQVAVRMF